MRDEERPGHATGGGPPPVPATEAEPPSKTQAPPKQDGRCRAHVDRELRKDSRLLPPGAGGAPCVLT